MRKRDLWIAAAALAAALLGAGTVLSRVAAPTAAWGLSFRQPGAPPEGSAAAEHLAAFDAAFLDQSGEKVLYLTFDAGYENGFTASILDTLREQQVPAAFFLVGHYIEKNADLVRRMGEEGHTVANHTMHHPDMSTLGEEAFARELQDLEELYREKTGRELSRFYRPPQGVYSEENLALAKKLGYRTVFWSLAYADWRNDAQPEEEAALRKLLDRTHPGAVVLLHSTSRTNAAILPRLLRAWQDLGYRFGRLEELFPAAPGS